MNKPLIGLLTAGMEEIVKQKQIPYSNLQDMYIQAVVQAGGIPLILPQVAPEDTKAQLERVDGLLLCGGADINPLLFGEEPLIEAGAFYQDRDDHELAAVKAAYDLDMPILAICRGIQMLNAALGGTLWQDIPSQTKCRLKHWQECPNSTASHSIRCVPGSRLYDILGEKCLVNSFHHQAIKDLASDLMITARDPGEIIEGVESVSRKFVLGVQWHPEQLISNSKPMAALFHHLVLHATEKTTFPRGTGFSPSAQ